MDVPAINRRVDYGPEEPYGEVQRFVGRVYGRDSFTGTIYTAPQGWRRRRYETWEENGQHMGRWTWEYQP